MTQFVIDHIDIVSACQLPDQDWEIWSDLCGLRPLHYGASLRPEFSRLLTTSRTGVYVARLQHAHRTVGFLPFVRDGAAVAHAPGQWLMSFQGMVCDPRYRVPANGLLAACGVKRMSFDRFVPADDEFSKEAVFTARSPCIDLREGYDTYHRDLRQRGSHLMKRLDQKRRRAVRTYGPVELIDATRNSERLTELLAWRRIRNREILAIDFLTRPWTQRFLDAINQQTEDNFRGRLFVLQFAGQPVAALLGIQTGSQLECVITAFAAPYAAVSPGLLLLQSIVQRASDYGIDFIHLTGGMDHFKERFENTEVRVASVIVGQSMLMRSVTRGAKQVEDWLRHTSLGPPLRRILRRGRLAREWMRRRDPEMSLECRIGVEPDRAGRAPRGV